MLAYCLVGRVFRKGDGNKSVLQISSNHLVHTAAVIICQPRGVNIINYFGTKTLILMM